MDNIFVLVLAGFIVGALGTLIGAGGGFILVPLLILTHYSLQPDIITAISIAIVAANAVSGTVAYARSKRIDYKAGIVFALFTIPGSVLGVYTVQYVPAFVFKIFFGLLLVSLAFFLFLKKPKPHLKKFDGKIPAGWKHHEISDKYGINYSYFYNQRKGIFISIIVGYISPLLGIGGGIIHVPALVQLLNFPVHVATATSHFILAIMSLVSVIAHVMRGSYNDAYILRMVIGTGVGAIGGAQAGAWLSHKIHSNIIIRALAICLALAGLRIALGTLL